MTGLELARAIRAAKGKIAIPMNAGDQMPYIFAEKQDLIAWANGQGAAETGMRVEPDGENFMLVSAD